MKWTSFGIVGLFVLGLSFSRCGGDSNTIDTVACPIGPAVDQIKIAESYFNKKVQLKTRVFYRASEYKRAWLGKRRPQNIYDAFVAEVKASSRYGFVPEDYHIDELDEAVEALYDNRKRTNADISNLDIRITASFFLFTTHLLEGRIRYPGAREFYWERGMPLQNDIVLLLKMESASDLRKELEGLHPAHPQYAKLQEALEKYRALLPSDTFPAISKAINLKPGDEHDQMPLIRGRLQLTDYNGKAPETPTRYDEALAKAVKRFQVRHGLEANGIIDAETVRLLNIPIEKKTELIVLNLERLRWLPHLQGEGDEIVINVPEYMLYVYRNNEEKMKMRVVLGAEFTPTPVFHDTLKYIVFSPTWNVPRSIFEKEFYPKLREDPAHFSPERFKFFKDGKEIDPAEEKWDHRKFDISKYSVIETPGDVNSLGKVKFIMPNDFSVYLHDTPADQLFKQEERALSHGCIRLEKPADFAAYLLADQKGWSEKRIREMMAGIEPKHVNLTEPYPVYIVYRTAWVDDDDRVHFREDVYGHDQRHLAYLK